MKHWSIRSRVLVLALLPAAIIATLLAIHFTDSRIRDLEAQLRERGQAIARQLAPACEYGMFVRNREILQALADSARKEADVVLVTVLDADADLLAVSGNTKYYREVPEPRSLASAQAGVVVSELPGALRFTAPIYQSGLRGDDYPEQNLPGAARSGPKRIAIIGWVTVTLSTESTRSRRDELLRNSLLISLLVLFVSGMLALRMSVGITTPLRRLVDAVGQISRGQLEVKVDSEAGGEIGVLAEGVRTMATNLKAAQENLQEKIDQATSQLSYQASHDTLTGLINRREFEARLEHALASAREQGATHGLCFLDLDQFKVVNDSCGHEAGDQLLRQLGYHLKHKIRDRDTLARLGGDEFALLLENCALENATEVARSLLDSIHAFRFAWQGRTFVIGGSMGIAMLNKKSQSVAQVLANADSACYTAKDLGRNRVYVYQSPEEGPGERVAGTSWVARINQALEEKRLVLYYQPIVALKNERHDRPRYFEALLRMKQDNGEVVLPMAFIPAAERYNLMGAIDRWVVEAAFRDYRRLIESGYPTQDVVFSINLSGSSVGDDKFAKFLEYQFSTYQVPPHRICFEVTETAAVTNLTQALALIQQQKRVGCRFMLDDFGSGLSSFTYLKNLPVDGIKIDGAFVKDMVSNSMDAAMVQAINHIGHVMGLTTVAEYVEDTAIIDKLRELNVDYIQGNAVQPPMPFEDCFVTGFEGQFRFKL